MLLICNLTVNVIPYGLSLGERGARGSVIIFIYLFFNDSSLKVGDMNLVCYMPKFVVRVGCSVVAVYNASEHLDVPFCSIVALISAAVPFEKPRVLRSFSFTFTIEIQ